MCISTALVYVCVCVCVCLRIKTLWTLNNKIMIMTERGKYFMNNLNAIKTRPDIVSVQPNQKDFPSNVPTELNCVIWNIRHRIIAICCHLWWLNCEAFVCMGFNAICAIFFNAFRAFPCKPYENNNNVSRKQKENKHWTNKPIEQ